MRSICQEKKNKIKNNLKKRMDVHIQLKRKVISRIRKSDMGRVLIYSILYQCYYLFLMVIGNNV